VPHRIQAAVEHLQAGRLLEARTVCLSLLAEKGPNPDLLHVIRVLGGQLLEGGYPEEAGDCFARVVAQAPDDLEALYQWGRCLYVNLDLEQAKEVVEGLIQLVPEAGNAHLLLGNIHQKAGEHEAAEACHREAVRVQPELVVAWHNLGNSLRAQRRLADAEGAYREALKRDPDHASSMRHLGLTLAAQNQADEAAELCDAAEKREPDSLVGAWQNARVLPLVYRDVSQVDRFRTRYREHLLALGEQVDLDSLESADDALNSIIDAFQLHYQARNDKDLQEFHGALVHRILSARYPEFARPISAPDVTGRKIRVGFASSVIRTHTVMKLFGGWMEQLDRTAFSVYGYHIGEFTDAVTDAFAGICEEFHHKTGDVEGLATEIRRDGIDVLIYPELGMDAQVLKLAALRLAPVQMVSWGHPITTGLPTIDCFLSSDLMEPPGGEAHYTESLVRLPGVSVCLKPTDPGTPARGRAELGLPEGVPLLLCPQSLFKLLPTDDVLFARIAAAAPEAHFVFLAHNSERVTADFFVRLGAAFEARGVDFDSRVHILGRQDWRGYLDMNLACDVLLDAPSWSGGVTTLEGIACGLVPVTCPGPMMRMRHTAAILQQAGVTQTVANDADAYVQIATRLVQDPDWRREIAGALAENRYRLERDLTCVRALEQEITARLTALRP
jgi:predicted O-linked N-acetylglucosamine transferase (SPINDLY family)